MATNEISYISFNNTSYQLTDPRVDGLITQHAPGYQNAFAGVYRLYPTFTFDGDDITVHFAKNQNGRVYWQNGVLTDANAAAEPYSITVPHTQYFVYDTVAKAFTVRATKTDILATDVICFYNTKGTIQGAWLAYYAMQCDAEKDPKIAEIKENSLDVIPDYYTADGYLDGKIDEIKNIGSTLGVNSLRFIFITDYHMGQNANQSPALMKYIVRKTGIRTIFFNGDYITSATTPQAGYNLLINFLDLIAPLREVAEVHTTTGNHEWNDPSASYEDRRLTRGPLIQLLNTYDRQAVTLDAANTNLFYVDFDAVKIRVYCVDLDFDSSLSTDSRKALFHSFEEVPEGYSVLLLSHHGTSGNTNATLTSKFAQVMDCAEALNNGETRTYSLKPSTSFSYTGKARNFIGALVGHTHVDGHYIYNNKFPVIVTECDAWAAQVNSTERTNGNLTEQAFDVVQLDLDAKRIYMTRIGHGSSRTFSFGDDGAAIVSGGTSSSTQSVGQQNAEMQQIDLTSVD